MDSGSSGREGFNEEEQMGKVKLPFTYSSSSSSPSPPSTSFQHKSQLARLTNSGQEEQPHQIYDNRRHWMNYKRLGNTYEPEDNYEATTTASTTRAADSKLVDSDSTLELWSGAAADIEKEHMFNKVVTPSDVGKLNRLVIPKQHAEKYFPLDSSTNEKGLLLNFEDRNGNIWRFRYSYWNSSQSYVMTKGWSRFVKDKKLDAGDIVSFQRGAGEVGNDRLFIDWRRRPQTPDMVSFHPHQHYPFTLDRSIPRHPLLMQPPTTGRSLQMGMGLFQRQQPIVFDSVPVFQARAAPKRLRLFGVNMECPISESDECEMLSTTTITHATMAPSQHPLQLRLYNGTPLPPTDFPNANKTKASLSFDLDI